jgi:hypothetical protein
MKRNYEADKAADIITIKTWEDIILEGYNYPREALFNYIIQPENFNRLFKDICEVIGMMSSYPMKYKTEEICDYIMQPEQFNRLIVDKDCLKVFAKQLNAPRQEKLVAILSNPIVLKKFVKTQDDLEFIAKQLPPDIVQSLPKDLTSIDNDYERSRQNYRGALMGFFYSPIAFNPTLPKEVGAYIGNFLNINDCVSIAQATQASNAGKKEMETESKLGLN